LARDGPRMLLISFVGYLGPSAFGLCAAKLIETRHVVTALWVAIILLVLLLFLVRKSFGVVAGSGLCYGSRARYWPLSSAENGWSCDPELSEPAVGAADLARSGRRATRRRSGKPVAAGARPVRCWR
jgi:hypothetical protein